MVFKIDGVDFSDMVETSGYVISPRRVIGDNSVTTLSGDYYEDLLAIKQDLQIVIVHSDQQSLSNFSKACLKPSVSLYLSNSITGEELLGVYYPEFGSLQLAIDSDNPSSMFWYSFTAKFKQR